MYILFHTGMRISEFCGLTLKDIDLENRTVNIDHQLQRTSDMRYIIETTKTDAGTRVLPITEDVAQMFQAIIEDRNAPKVEKSIDGYSGFLFMIRECHLWQCTGNIVSIIWSADTMTFTGCRCQTLRLMYADTPIARIWQNRE